VLKVFLFDTQQLFDAIAKYDAETVQQLLQQHPKLIDCRFNPDGDSNSVPRVRVVVVAVKLRGAVRLCASYV
jgi:hypothetical protein